MRLAFLIVLGLLCSLAAGSSAQATGAGGSQSIAVVVNEGAITRSDVEDRMRLIGISSGLPDNPETRAKLLPQIVSSLIDEEIRLQEAKKAGVDATQPEIDAGFKQIAEQNKFPPEKFREILQKSGINATTMERQIRSQIAWGKVVQAKIRPQITVSDSDVDAKLSMIEASKGKNEYLVAEVFIPVDDAKNEASAQQLAQQLANDVQSNKIPFFKVAQQFSKSAGAAGGGDLGWVQEGQLAPELEQAIVNLEPNNVSNPVRSLSGYHILMVRERRVVTAENMPSREQVLNMLGQERLERQARRYLMDLKSAAFVDNRLKS